MHPLEPVINEWFTQRHQITSQNAPAELKEDILQVITALDQGILRVAEKIEGVWHTHEWLKKAILLFFIVSENKQYDATSVNRYYDKIPTKFIGWDQDKFSQAGIRVVPGAIARQGAYIAKNAILMPSYTNIGAYIDEGTMVDSWVTVGSCAQIGKQVHLSSSVVIGGVLEPLQASPTIIEDNCFIGHVLSLSRVSLSKKVQSLLQGYQLVNRPVFTTEKHKKSPMDVFRPVRLWCQDIYR